MPAALRSRMGHRPDLIRILSNIGWLFSDKVLRMGMGLLVGVWVARYLGPGQFGLLNFAAAFVGLFSAISTLGLQGIVVRDLVKDGAHAREILGTSFMLQLVGGLVAYLLVLGIIGYLRPDDALAKIIVAVLGFTLLLRAGDSVRYWFESQVHSRYVVWVENGVFLVTVGAKISLIVNQATLMAFVWLALAEAVLVAALLVAVYAWRTGEILLWRPRLARAQSLLNDSWPLILSGLAIMVYMRIDQIMLGQMLGDKAVGIYTAAVRISELWYFIPMAIVASVFPAIIEAKKNNQSVYYRRFQTLYDLMVLLALVVALPMTFLSGWVVSLLFGYQYAEAGPVLAVHIWAGIFVALGVASSQWLLVEKLQLQVLYQTVLGAIINIILNYALIPRLGVVGAATATVLAYFVSVFSVAFFVKSRPCFNMMTKAFSMPELRKVVFKC